MALIKDIATIYGPQATYHKVIDQNNVEEANIAWKEHPDFQCAEDDL